MSPEQFSTHILPLKHKLYRFAHSFLGVAEDAQDVVQEVMLNAWENLQSPKAVRNPEAWCMSLVRNKSLNLLKKKGRNYLPLAEQFDLATPEQSPFQHTANQESFQQVQRLITQLPENQRSVILLRDMEGYSYKEIAQILSLDLNHIKVLLFRARQRIKQQFSRVDNYGISQTQ